MQELVLAHLTSHLERIKLMLCPYTLQLNIFQIAQHYKQPHQKHRQKTYNHENSQWEFKKISD